MMVGAGVFYFQSWCCKIPLLVFFSKMISCVAYVLWRREVVGYSNTRTPRIYAYLVGLVERIVGKLMERMESQCSVLSREERLKSQHV